MMAELAALEEPRAREVNERHGDDHGVNLGKLRAVATRLKTQQDLARELWATDDTAAKLLALLICRPKAFGRDELDAMLRGARTPKVHDWLVNYVVKKSPQWAMNHCLAQIGIEHAQYRSLAIGIGERLGVLKDYPTAPDCTSPYAPIWINEMVRRQTVR